MDALSNLGAAYVQLGQFEDAIARYNAALQMDPNKASVRLNLGTRVLQVGASHEAIAQLKMVDCHRSEREERVLILADCYLQTGQIREPVAVLEPREPMFGDDLALRTCSGRRCCRPETSSGGRSTSTGSSGAGESAEGHLLMGLAHLGRFGLPGGEDGVGARSPAQSAAADGAIGYTAGRCWGWAIRPEAEKAFRSELAVNINDFESNLMLGSMRKSAQDFDNAAMYLARAVAIHPGDLPRASCWPPSSSRPARSRRPCRCWSR